MILSTISTLFRNQTTRTFAAKKINANQPSLISQIKWKSTTVSSESEKSKKDEYSSDSDAEEEHRRKDSFTRKGSNEFWRRKMRTFHGLLDLNKDGVISYDDCQIMIDRFINLGNLDPSHHEEFNEVVQRMWEERWGTVSPFNFVTTEQYLEDMYHVVNDPQLRKKVHNFLPYLFKALDKDKNGYITSEEYKLFFNCLGLGKDVAMVSFTAVDQNLDGQLTLKEFVSTGRDFFLTEDERRPSKFFWGPLVK